jgi:GNAT superfamily N-acetyltransferase
MTEIRVEVGRGSDLEPFIALLESAASWLWERGVHQWVPGSMRAEEPVLAERARDGHLMVARSESDLVGGCILVPHAAPEWYGHTEPSLYVHKLVVARSHAGQGIAQRILAGCADRARALGARRLRLDCWDGNAALRSFYRACAYRELEAVPSHGYLVRLFESNLGLPARISKRS